MRLHVAGLVAAISIAGFAGGYGVALYLNLNTYKGPEVAGFTTGGLRCSPFCGHLDELRALQPRPIGPDGARAPEPRPSEKALTPCQSENPPSYCKKESEKESNGLALGLGLGSGHGAGIGIGIGF